MPSTDPVPDLPEPSPELILILALVSAHLKTLSKKDRDRFMVAVSESLGLQAASYNVLRFRPRSEDRKVFMAMHGAAAWWTQSLSVLVRLMG